MRRPYWFAVVVGSFAGLQSAVAWAQDAAPDGMDPAARAGLWLAAASGAVAAIIAALRSGVPALAPEPATARSKLANLIICLVAGPIIAVFGGALAMPDASLSARIMGGIIAGSLAMTGRNGIAWGARAAKGTEGP